ncbi:hypothetical protein ACLMJK_001327 [Lecanora helva]
MPVEEKKQKAANGWMRSSSRRPVTLIWAIALYRADVFPILPRPQPLRRLQSSLNTPPKPSEGQRNTQDAVSHALRTSESNSLLTPVHMPYDPQAVLTEEHPAASILSHSSVVVTRQLELMNVMLGFEQANKYVVMDPQGSHVGYMAERELGMGNMMARQMFSTHRSFTTHVFDRKGQEVLRFHRPFAWISSRIGIYEPVKIGAHAHNESTAMSTSTSESLTTDLNPGSAQVSSLDLKDMRIIGEAQQQWAPLRRKYNLFLYRNAPPPESRPESEQRAASPSNPLSNSQAMDLTPYTESGSFTQFAYVDEPFLSWDFSLFSSDSKLIGSVNRNFSGFGREIFTDTGVYALRMDAAQEKTGAASDQTSSARPTEEMKVQAPGKQSIPPVCMTLDQRAVMLATAVSVDFDYFSRHSGSGGGTGFMPMWFPGGGGGDAAPGEAGAEEGAGGEVAERGDTQGKENAAVGAGSMAGYEAMQRGRGMEQGSQEDQGAGNGEGGADEFLADDGDGGDSGGWDDFFGGDGGGGDF